MVNAFFQGIRLFFAGLKLLAHPRILPFVVVPVIVNALLFYAGFNYFNDLFANWISGFIEKIPDWLGFLQTFLTWLFKILLLIIFTFSFTFFANLIGSPFYGLMAEQVEAIKDADAQQNALNIRQLLLLIPRALLRELQKLTYYLLRAIPLVILSLIAFVVTPLTTITPVLWFLFGASMLSIQYIDYAYDNHQISFRELAKDLKKDRAASLGFGAACTLATMIPFFNILAVPAASCAGTVYFVERLKKKR